jgi:hypothetical protein
MKQPQENDKDKQRKQSKRALLCREAWKDQKRLRMYAPRLAAWLYNDKSYKL